MLLVLYDEKKIYLIKLLQVFFCYLKFEKLENTQFEFDFLHSSTPNLALFIFFPFSNVKRPKGSQGSNPTTDQGRKCQNNVMQGKETEMEEITEVKEQIRKLKSRKKSRRG